MLDDGSCAESICCFPGMSGDFQHLAERTKCLSRHLGGVIRAPVGDHHDPDGVVPARVTVGCEKTGNAFGDDVGVIAHRYDDPDCLDFRC